MINIPISEVKKFIAAAKPIRDTKLLPIYAYVKLECEGTQAIFYKSNGHSFVVCHVDAQFGENESLLIEEKTLFGFVQYSRGTNISIKRKGDSVVIDDGNRNISCKTHPIAHFPAIQPKDGENSIVLTEEVLLSLFLAKSHSLPPTDDTMRPPVCFVHIAKVGKFNFIAAWNQMVGYLKSFKEELPNISLDPETVSVISRFQLLSYSRCGNYDYFDGGGISYGFIKTECRMPDITPLVENFKHTTPCTINRRPLVDFCEMVINVNSSSLPPEVALEVSDKAKILLSFSDASGEQTATEKLSVEGKMELKEPFIFQPKNVLTVLKDLSCDKITISYVKGNILITSDEEKGYTGSIMGLTKL